MAPSPAPRHLVSTATVMIHASAAKVWHALITPALIKQYMFGADVAADWKVGGAITWAGEFKGKPYQDKGVILRLEPQRRLDMTHFSPLAGKPDVPENYHTLTYALSEQGGKTALTLSQDNNLTEQEREHTAKAWQGMLDALKALLEK